MAMRPVRAIEGSIESGIGVAGGAVDAGDAGVNAADVAVGVRGGGGGSATPPADRAATRSRT